MRAATGIVAKSKLSVFSSISDDVWHRNATPGAYEWWYFDAMSDDGSEAVIISFLDNSVYSPRYNRKLNTGPILSGSSAPVSSDRLFPAVFFAYYQGGKPFYRAFNEFTAAEFDADDSSPACRIGESGFRFDSAPYGSGYSIHVSSSLGRGRTLEAKFEWLSIESDFRSAPPDKAANCHIWNIVAPRSDVSGRLQIRNKKGEAEDVKHFRGTGYHDHEIDPRWLADTVSEKLWGRVHFADMTAVFQKFHESGCEACARLYIVKDGSLIEREVRCDEQSFVRNKFGIKYPSRITLTSDDNIRLRIKPVNVLDSSFYNLRFASEMTLTLRDGKPRKSMGITELVAPKTLKYRWLDWLADMRIMRVR